MGLSLKKGDLVKNPAIDSTHPAALVYAPDPHGGPHLAALEYVVIKSDWDGDGTVDRGDIFETSDFDAEEAYRLSTTQGGSAQPGLALLRLAQGKRDAALAAIRRTSGETDPPLDRAALLPAYVEIALAAEEIEEAARASDELTAIATCSSSVSSSSCAETVIVRPCCQLPASSCTEPGATLT